MFQGKWLMLLHQLLQVEAFEPSISEGKETRTVFRTKGQNSKISLQNSFFFMKANFSLIMKGNAYNTW